MTEQTWPLGSAVHPRKDFGGHGRNARPRGGSAIGSAQFPQFDTVFVLTALLLASALLFGGASRLNVAQTAGLELISLPVIGVAIWRLHLQGALRSLAVPLALLGAVAAIPLLQLLPVPIDVWRALPGRAHLAAGLEMVGMKPWQLIFSVAPDRTAENALALLVPIGVALGTFACSRDQRRALMGIVVVAAIASLLLAIAQSAGGPDGPLVFYGGTDIQFANGVFANRNHQALFLLLSLPMIAALVRPPSSRVDGKTIAGAVAMLGFLLIMLVGVAETRSRGGLLLTLPAIVGAWAVFQRSNRGQRINLVVLALGAVLVLALGGALIAFHAEVLHRFSAPLQAETRQQIWASTLQAAHQFAPLGAGIGSFDRIYPSVETTQAMQAVFVNHAHNDYLELWLEAGAPGIAVLAAWGVWFLARAVTSWRRRGGSAQLAQAGSVAVVLIALHSTIDYPVRTLAIMSVLALSCALLAVPFGKGTNASALRETYPS
jgi:O-antigen ligase